MGVNLSDPQFLVLDNAAINSFGVHEPQALSRCSIKESGVGLPFCSAPGRRDDLLGWRARMGRSSSTAPLGQWPGLAGKVCVSDEWGQPTPCPVHPLLS